MDSFEPGDGINNDGVEPKEDRIEIAPKKIPFEGTDFSDVSTWREDLKVTDGKWVEFPAGVDPEQFIPEGFDKTLFASLQTYPTGWDIATDSQIAKSRLSIRDIYIYYSNKGDDACVPRAIVETYGGNIKSVGGVGYKGNFDPFISDVVVAKVSDLGGDDDVFQEKSSDLKTLSNLYLRICNSEKPVMDDYVFIYGLKKKIKGFSDVPDPMIRAVKNMLPPIKLNEILANYPIWEGDLLLDGIKRPEKLVLPKEVTGNVSLKDLSYHLGITLPEKIKGNLNLASILNAQGLKLPKEIAGNLQLWNLETAEGLVLPGKVDGLLELLSLKDVAKLVLHEGISGINIPNLEDATGLVLPQKMKGKIMLNGIKQAKGLNLPISIGSLELNDLINAEGLVLPQEVTGDIDIPHLHKVSRLVFPQIVGGRVNLRCLNDMVGISLPEEIGGDLRLEGLVSVPPDFVFPWKVGGDFILQHLRSGNNVTFPRIVGGNFLAAPLDSAEGFIFPEEVGKDFKAYGITSALGFKFPKKVGGDIYVNAYLNISETIRPLDMGGGFIQRYRQY